MRVQKCGLYIKEGVNLEFISSSFTRPIQFLPIHAKLAWMCCKVSPVSFKRIDDFTFLLEGTLAVETSEPFLS